MMPLSEKVLYHQIHPFKLATDVTASVVSLYLFWRHDLVLAIVLHLAPPILASALVISCFDLLPQQQSAFGRYVKRWMSRSVEAIRLGGDIVTVFAAWYHSATGIGIGVLIILAAWLSGLARSP